jgi:PAS domain-containing protein
MTDVGIAILDSIYQKMMIDEKWSIRRSDGFTWWGYRLAQHVEIDTPDWDDSGDIWAVRIWTDVARDVDAGSDPARIIGTFNMHQTLSAYVWDQWEGTITERCTAFVHKDNFDHIANLLATAAVLQNSSAHTRAHTIAEMCGGVPNSTDHPSSGQRPEMDDLLNVPERLVVPEGRKSSTFAGPPIKRLLDFLTYQGIPGRTSEAELNCMVPFADPQSAMEMTAAVMVGSVEGPPMSHVQILTDVAHPGVGNGALVLMWTPVSEAPEKVNEIANRLNALESGGDSGVPLLGAWCLDPTSKDPPRLAFYSFLPNLIARNGMLESQVLYLRDRSAYASCRFRGSARPVATDSSEHYAALSPDLTISRRAAAAEAGDFTVVYRTDDGRIISFDEAFDELTPELAEGLEGLPPEEQVIDGGDVQEYINESGIYKSIEVEGRIVTHYTDGQTRWSADQLRDHVLPTVDGDGLRFEDWLAAQVDTGELIAVDVLQYLGDEDEDADVQVVIAERLIVD